MCTKCPNSTLLRRCSKPKIPFAKKILRALARHTTSSTEASPSRHSDSGTRSWRALAPHRPWSRSVGRYKQAITRNCSRIFDFPCFGQILKDKCPRAVEKWTLRITMLFDYCKNLRQEISISWPSMTGKSFSALLYAMSPVRVWCSYTGYTFCRQIGKRTILCLKHFPPFSADRAGTLSPPCSPAWCLVIGLSNRWP